jgi:hypothetical protein
VAREIEFYRLEVIVAVGYRVKSARGTQFRQWATTQLPEYLVKGFAMDVERLKQAGGGGYFDELLARIRDIRSSERVFWRKVLDIYATSVGYDLAGRPRRCSSRSCRTRCIGLRTATPRPRSSPGAPTRANLTWA